MSEIRVFYEETPGAVARRAFGIIEASHGDVEQRAAQIRKQADVSFRSSEAMAAAELAARPLIPVRVDDWNRRMRAVDPFWEQDGLMPLRDGVCRTERGSDGELVYHGGGAEMRATLAEADRLHRERERAAASAPRAVRLR